MECIDPGLITPDDMLAFASGAADARTSTHIAACAACAAQSARYAGMDRTLRARFFRADCLPALTLGELALSLLDPETALAARGHLALCPYCAAELATIEAEVRDDPLADVAPRPGRLARLVARLLPAPATGMAYSGVRGAAESTTLSYGAAGLTLSLSIEAESGTARRWTLLLLVLREDGAEPPSGAVASLLQGERVAAEATLDEWGNLALAGLESSVYSLELALPDRVIVVEGIEIGP